MSQHSPYLDFALGLGRAAAKEIMPRFQRVSIETKADGTEVTEADRQAEAVMRNLIGEKFPSHAILGEEGGETPGSSDLCWVLDPIDGTTWFSLGIPKFGTLIALLEDREPVLGVIHLPATDEVLYAETGGGCWYRHGKQESELVRVDNKIESLSEAFVSSAGVHNSEILPELGPGPFQMTEIIRSAKKFRFVGDCVQHMLVARGILHAALDSLMQPWDSAALIPCLREAGGTVSTMDGDFDNTVFGGSLITSCSASLHDDLLSKLNP